VIAAISLIKYEEQP